MSHILQHVLFPLERDPDILPLYADPETWTVIRREPVQVSSEAHVNDIVSRTSYRVRRGQRVSFASYFNAFPAAYWQRWTVVDSVRLTLNTAGEGNVIVYRSTAQGVQQRIDSAAVKGAQEVSFDLPITAFGDGGWYWFDVESAGKSVEVTMPLTFADVQFMGPDHTMIAEPGLFDVWLCASAQTGQAAQFTLVR